MRGPKRVTRGRTLLQAIAVVVVAGVLTALIFPAITRSREASRQLQCQRNLQRCANAMHAYHDLHRCLPPGIVAAGAPGMMHTNCDFVASISVCDWPGRSVASGFTLVLPYLDEKPVHSMYNLDLACCSSANATAVAVRISVLNCPSNQRSDRPSRFQYYQPSGVAIGAPEVTDYALSAGGTGALQCTDPRSVSAGGAYYAGIPGQMRAATGVFLVNAGACVDYIKDGVSNTFLLGESFSGGVDPIGTHQGHVVGGTDPMTAQHSQLESTNPWSKGFLGGAPGGDGRNNGGYGSVLAVTAWNPRYDFNRVLMSAAMWTAVPPNEAGLRSLRPTWYRQSILNIYPGSNASHQFPGFYGSIQGFRSRHTGIVQMLLADGSLRVISNGIDPMLWVALSTADGREQLPDPQ